MAHVTGVGRGDDLLNYLPITTHVLIVTVIGTGACLSWSVEWTIEIRGLRGPTPMGASLYPGLMALWGGRHFRAIVRKNDIIEMQIKYQVFTLCYKYVHLPISVNYPKSMY